jgi:DNA integrity scanning protein DisA with diadenylate cyclase activity
MKNRIWTVCYDNIELMRSEYSNIYFSKTHINYTVLNKVLKSVLEIENTDKLVKIIESAGKQTQGTMIVFSREAEIEAQRLKNTSISIEKRDLSIKTHHDIKFIKFITSIDGAILCDETGCCYSIGVILDGITDQSEESAEDISRGARHNSAHRYCGQRKNCVAVIISEDGDVSIIPNY